MHVESDRPIGTLHHDDQPRQCLVNAQKSELSLGAMLQQAAELFGECARRHATQLSVVAEHRTHPPGEGALTNGKTRARPDDELGGSSYSFHVWPGHPAEARARQLLESTRKRVGSLWDEIASYNREHGLTGKDVTRVNFYFGQSVTEQSGSASEEDER